MGTIHKFKRKPKNQQQFKGNRPPWPGGSGKGDSPKSTNLWQKLRPWQQSSAAWALLVGTATAIVVARSL